jgi:hypothetical protein
VVADTEGYGYGHGDTYDLRYCVDDGGHNSVADNDNDTVENGPVSQRHRGHVQDAIIHARPHLHDVAVTI